MPDEPAAKYGPEVHYSSAPLASKAKRLRDVRFIALRVGPLRVQVWRKQLHGWRLGVRSTWGTPPE